MIRAGGLLVLILVSAAMAHACTSEQAQERAAATRGGQTVVLATPETLPVTPGERWGGFLFVEDPAAYRVPPDQVTPALRPLKGDEGESLIDGHPGFRAFATVDELAQFVAGRGPVRVPAFLPAGAQLMRGEAVEGDDAELLEVGLNYRVGDSAATPSDPDLWIVWVSYQQRPAVFPTHDQESVLAPRRLMVRGREAIYLEARSPGDRSSLNWFENDGRSWAVQGRHMDLATLVAVAESLTDYP